MFKVIYKDTGRRPRVCSGFFVANFEHISQDFPVFLFLNLNMEMFAGLTHLSLDHLSI